MFLAYGVSDFWCFDFSLAMPFGTAMLDCRR
jgi:hypothetical protein